MKRIYISSVCLLISGLIFAQTSISASRPDAPKIKLANGQKIVIESTTDIQASLTMGMEMISNSSTINSLIVKNSSVNNYTIGNTLTRMKVNMNAMGQSGSYNSDNKEGNSEEMAKLFDEKMNQEVDVVIDNKTATAISEKKKEKKVDDSDAANPAADLMKMFADNSDEATVAGAFQIIPKGKSVGDSWADTTSANDMKTISTYTLKNLTGNEALIQSVITTAGKSKLNFQEMEFELKIGSKTIGEIVSDISTGLVSKRTNVAEITGSIQMMGQDMPISAKSTIINIYR
jgi:hypothetical protein